MGIRKRLLVLAVVVSVAFLPAFAKRGDGSGLGFDPKADAVKQVKAAVAKASAENKHILLEVGGAWCSWCHKLEAFLGESNGIREALDAAFVVVKINVSPENENVEFMSAYPEVRGYPHIFVLDSDGTFLHSQETGALESGETYDAARWREFIDAWGGGS
jgi:thioredoxin-related protein